MTTTEQTFSIIGIPVTGTEFDRFMQIRREMLASGNDVEEAEHWAACSIGIERQFAEAVESNDWDCGSGMCDPNTGCPACTDRDSWTRAR